MDDANNATNTKNNINKNPNIPRGSENTLLILDSFIASINSNKKFNLLLIFNHSLPLDQ